ncbi:hypothetical protein SH528x_007059 [Novipirellula sp. SH528]
MSQNNNITYRSLALPLFSIVSDCYVRAIPDPTTLLDHDHLAEWGEARR